MGDTGGQRDGDTPEEGELLPVHPGLEAQRWVLPEGWHDEAEEQRDADEDGGQDDLPGAGGQGRLRALLPHPLPTLRTTAPSHPRSPARTCAKKPRVLRRAWSILLMKRARSCWRVSAQPLTLRQACPAAPRSRSVSWGSSAARAEMGLAPAPAEPAVRGRGSCRAARRGTVCWQGRPPTPAGMGHCMRGHDGTPSPPSPQLLPRRAPWAQCKGEERGVTATPVPARPQLAPIQGSAGSPNYCSPPDSRGWPHASTISRRRGLDTSPGISCPIPTPTQSWAPPNPPLSLLLALPNALGDTPRPNGSDAARVPLSLPLPAACPKGRVSEGMPADGCMPGWTRATAPAQGVEVGGTQRQGLGSSGVPGLSSPLLTQLPVSCFCVPPLAGGCSSPGA